MTREEALQLFAEYNTGELGPEKRDQLFAELMENQDLYNAFAEQQIVSELFADPVVRREARAVLSERNPIRARFPRLAWIWGLGLASAAVLSLMILVHLHNQSQHAQPSEIAQGKLGREKPQVVMPPTVQNPGEGTASTQESPPGTPQKQQPRLLAFALLPGTRSAGADNTLHLAPTIQTVLLTAALGEGGLRTYSAVLATANGKTIRTFEGLQPRATQGGEKTVTTRVPAQLLPPGDFTLILSGIDEQGKQQTVGGYSFHVVRH